MDSKIKEYMDRLSLADPKVANRVSEKLECLENPVSPELISMMVEDTIWGLSQEESFGNAISSGYIKLLKNGASHHFFQYSKLVQKEGKEGPALGRMMASFLVSVLLCGEPIIVDQFLTIFKIMKKWGTNTLNNPFQALTVLLNEKDLTCARLYLDLLGVTFEKEQTYSQCCHFSQILPRAVLSFPVAKRTWQIRELIRAIQTDLQLADPFIQGLEKELFLLSKKALQEFVTSGFKKYQFNPKFGKRFFSLDSRSGIETYESMQVAVSIHQVRPQIVRYLQARTGHPVAIRPISDLKNPEIYLNEERAMVLSDGKVIYMPDVIDIFNKREENQRLYQCLARFEAGYYEYNTFDFDIEKLSDRYAETKVGRDTNSTFMNMDFNFPGNEDHVSDLDQFFNIFSNPKLAFDLFVAFEHYRIRILLSRDYPGLIKKNLPILQNEAKRMVMTDENHGSIFFVYLALSLDLYVEKMSVQWQKILRSISDRLDQSISENNSVETTGMMVTQTYHEVENLLMASNRGRKIEFLYTPLTTPFGRTLNPSGFFSGSQQYEDIVNSLMFKFREKGIRVYRSDIRKKVQLNHGYLTQEDIQTIFLNSGNQNAFGNKIKINHDIDLSYMDISRFMKTNEGGAKCDATRHPVTWHREWDHHMGDYLNRYVRVIHRTMNHAKNDYYEEILKKNHGLVRGIRYSFELLKPEGIKILRQWIDGDEFDYRALIDYSIDVKTGRSPSERLYVKRIKQQRDVGVMLLVDLSRSTVTKAAGTSKTVIDVEKEAIVLFSEALEVVGDTFSITGFSGTGRLGVDYFMIKDFHETLDNEIKNRIGNMSPQRSTRMGAAIRQAGEQFNHVDSKVRLLIILGDGFPNDSGYKQDYAIEDTRKAISELRAKNIHVHAITVNITEDPKLDKLYSHIHHNVISEVSELPNKLIRIYGNLTRS